jgi:hypothetical protein
MKSVKERLIYFRHLGYIPASEKVTFLDLRLGIKMFYEAWIVRQLIDEEIIKESDLC